MKLAKVFVKGVLLDPLAIVEVIKEATLRKISCVRKPAVIACQGRDGSNLTTLSFLIPLTELSLSPSIISECQCVIPQI